MSSLIGRQLAHYRILEMLGSGGMGDVYLADDTKLDPRIALKVLPAELAENEERRARFEREAKTLAALNHPRIVSVYSVEEADEVHFITMELVKGQRLTGLLPKHGFGLDKFFDIAIPLADAVAAAHEHGITHRDLKPDNVMATGQGEVKVLDFGLAKTRSGFGKDSSPESPTAVKTQEGSIVGTVHYMSPEQAQGTSVDHRSDIFSLGIIFYEMLTGTRPFRGDTPGAVLSSIIKDEPAALERVPDELARIVKRCLAKALSDRRQSARDLRNELQDVRSIRSGPRARTEGGRTRSLRVVAALLLVSLGVLVGNLARSDRTSRRLPRLTNPVRITTDVGLEDYPAWSPDGSAITYSATLDADYYTGSWDIWVKQVGSGEAVNRTVDHPGTDTVPSWSPDGTQIAFWSDRDGGGYYVMSAVGGTPRKVAAFVGPIASPPQWSQDSTELACVVQDSDSKPLLEIIHLDTRESRRIALPGDDFRRLDLAWSPNGKLVAYIDVDDPNSDATHLRVLRLEDQASFPITSGLTSDWSPTWATNNRTLFFTSGRAGNLDLWQQALAADGSPDGKPSPLTGGVGLRRVALAADGERVAYSKGRLVGNLWRVPILPDRPATWNDAEQLTFDEAQIEFVDISPDRTRVLFDSDRGGNTDLWILALTSKELVRVTTDDADDFGGRWSPDGETIAFYSFRKGNRDIWVQGLDGGPARQLTHEPSQEYLPEWSPDGATLVYQTIRGQSWRLRTMKPDGTAQNYSPTAGLAAPHGPDWSPRGNGIVLANWVDEHTLWLQAEPGAEPQRIGNGLAHFGRWSIDGEDIYFIPADARAGNIWALSLDDGSERPMTDFAGSNGGLVWMALATDGDYLYFAWHEILGDIWMMDVVY